MQRAATDVRIVHHRIFATEPHSYRDLPSRLAEYGCCDRYEQSGELFGLNFPLWLACDQVRVITIDAEDDPASAALVKYAKDIANELRGQMVRVSTDFGNNPINSDKSRAGG